MLTSLNTSHNRKLDLINAIGKLITQKNGEFYFYMVVNGVTEYFKCEENLFHKNFAQTTIAELKELNEEEWSELKKKCKKYPY